MEVSRRIAEAHSVFHKLESVWHHCNIHVFRKQELYFSCVVSKLLYSLEGVLCKAVDRQRLNAFHCRCLRKIHRIPHAYYSRISNSEVLYRAWSKPLSDILLCRQMSFYAELAALDHSNIMRCCFFAPDTYHPRQWLVKRKRGRPKLEWANVIGAYVSDLL